jgi:hypothetical protein
MKQCCFWGVLSALALLALGRPVLCQATNALEMQATVQAEAGDAPHPPLPTVQTSAADAPDASQRSLSNLKQISLGLLMYVQDNDEILPPLQNPAVIKKALLPYVRNEQLFVQPKTHRPYRPNASLSHRSLASVKDPAAMVIFYEDAPDQNSTRAVAFLDGHIKRIPESQWPALKRASHVH